MNTPSDPFQQPPGSPAGETPPPPGSSGGALPPPDAGGAPGGDTLPQPTAGAAASGGGDVPPTGGDDRGDGGGGGSNKRVLAILAAIVLVVGGVVVGTQVLGGDDDDGSAAAGETDGDDTETSDGDERDGDPDPVPDVSIDVDETEDTDDDDDSSDADDAATAAQEWVEALIDGDCAAVKARTTGDFGRDLPDDFCGAPGDHVEIVDVEVDPDTEPLVVTVEVTAEGETLEMPLEMEQENGEWLVSALSVPSGRSDRGDSPTSAGPSVEGDPERAIGTAEHIMGEVMRGDCENAASHATSEYEPRAVDDCELAPAGMEMTGARLADRDPVTVVVDASVGNDTFELTLSMKYENGEWKLDDLELPN